MACLLLLEYLAGVKEDIHNILCSSLPTLSKDTNNYKAFVRLLIGEMRKSLGCAMELISVYVPRVAVVFYVVSCHFKKKKKEEEGKEERKW